MAKSLRCWAASLGNCSDKQSAEHYISRCLLQEKVLVQGFSWCKNEPKEVGRDRLTRNMLCERHNNQISPVDTYAKLSIDTLNEVQRVVLLRTRIGAANWSIKKIKLDGHLFERWFLKTVINFTFGHDNGIGRDCSDVGMPSEHLVRVAFGLEQFEGFAGLYSLTAKDMNIGGGEGVQITSMLDDQSRVVMGRFDFFGFPYVLSLIPDKFEAFRELQMIHRVRRHVWSAWTRDRRQVASHIVEWTWN